MDSNGSSPAAKRTRLCSPVSESCHFSAVTDSMARQEHVNTDVNTDVNNDVHMSDESDDTRDSDDTSDASRQYDRCRRKTPMPIMERFFLGLLTEREVYEKGLRLTQEQLSYYRRIRGSYY